MRVLTIGMAFVVAALLSFASLSQADPIASESFATSGDPVVYVADTTILGQDPTTGSTGFVGPWGSGTISIFLPTAGGLSHKLTPGVTAEGELIVSHSEGNSGFAGAESYPTAELRPDRRDVLHERAAE